MLSQYYVSSVPTEVMRAIAEDWHDGLSAYPEWAIQKACRWWMSESNEVRHRKPVVGDIAARAHREMEMVRVAKIALRRKGFGRQATVDEPINLEERRAAADDILRQAGFSPKRFGGEE